MAVRIIQLLDPADDREHALSLQDQRAATLKAMGYTPRYRAKVMNRKGWGVWLVEDDEA